VEPKNSYANASTDAQKWYLVPADNPQQASKVDAYYSPNHANTNGDPEKPFLTTYPTNKDKVDVPIGVTKRANNSVWIVKKTGDYYYIIHAATGKYVIYEVPLPNDPDKNDDATEGNNGKRKTMHLQTPDDEEGTGTYRLNANDNFKFKISQDNNKTYYNITPMNRSGWYWNPAGGNKDKYYGTKSNIYQEGLVGVYNSSTDGGSKWHFEEKTLSAPTINVTHSRVTVTENNGLPEGYNVRYTFSSEGTPADPTASSTVMGSDGYLVTEAGTLKVVIERYGIVLTGVAEQEVSPVYCATPVISFDYSSSEVSITCATEGATIYYTLDGSTPTAESTQYDGAFLLTENATVKAIAVCTDYLNSEVATQTINQISSPVISYNGDNIEITPPGEGYDIYYTKDGSTPTVSEGIKYTDPLTPEDVEGAIEIKAFAVDQANTNRFSEVTSFLLYGENRKLLIQSQTTAHFYLMPGDEGGVKVTSLLHPTMQWYLMDAGTTEGKQYYYIVNGKDNTKRLAYEEGSCKVLDGADDDKFKFQIEESAGVYSIIPNGQTTAISCDGNSQWNFVLPSTIANITAPFTTTDANNAYFYKIGASGHNIKLTDDGVTTSNSTAEADQQAMAWYFERVETETTEGVEAEEDWLTYYHIRSGLTGDYLYLSDTDVFTWARTTAADSYYIVPKTSLDIESAITLDGYKEWNITAVDYFCAKPVVTIDEEGNVVMKSATRVAEIYYTIDGTVPTVPSRTGLRPTAPTRQYSTEFQLDLEATAITAVAAMKNREQQSEPVVIALEQCAAPTGVYSGVGGSLQLSTETPGAEIYYTVDDTDPLLVSSTSHGESPIILFEANKRSKVFARTARHGWKKSEPYKLEVVYMPTITLAQTSYTYTGEKLQPEITSVTVKGESDAIPTTYYEVFGLTDNEDAGTARFGIIQKEGAPYMIFGTADFKILKAELTAVTLSAEEFEYNHRRQTAEVTSVKAGSLDVDKVNYTVSGNIAQDKGVYTVTVTANDETNYTGTVTKTFEIKAKPLTGTDITINLKRVKDNDTYAYTPTIKDGYKTLVLGEDYEMSDPVATTEGYKRFTFKGKGNFSSLDADSRTLEYVDLTLEKVRDSRSDYAALFAAKVDMATPVGMTVYVVTGANSRNMVDLQKLNYVPKDVPVLLVDAKESLGFVKQGKPDDVTALTATDEPVKSNKLMLTTASRHFDVATIYLFYNGEFVHNTDGYLAADKVYLDLGASAPSGAPRLSIVLDGTTGIDDVCQQQAVEGEDRWYTLDGRLLQQRPTAPGLYLNNGRKVVIKKK